MFQLEQFANGRFDVLTENGMRAGSILGAAGNWCAEVGNRVVGYFKTQEDAARSILDQRGIKGIFDQMTAIIEAGKLLDEAYADDFYVSDRKFVKEWACATNLLWIVRPFGTHIVQLDLPTSKREGSAVLDGVHPEITGRPWQIYLVDAAALKVTPISEAQARHMVAQTPRYGYRNGSITFMDKPVAAVKLSLKPGHASFDRRCLVTATCIEEPGRQRLQAISRLAFHAATPSANEGAFCAPAEIAIFYGRKRLYHWTAQQ